MNEIGRDNKIKKLFCYILFLFAFICVGFVSNNMEVEAKHEIEILDNINYQNNTVSFTYFYDSAIDKEIEYWFTVDGEEIYGTVAYENYDTNIGVVTEGMGKKLTYHVSIDGLVVNDKDTSFSVNTTRNFSMRVYVESWYLFIKSSDEDVQDFRYIPSIPSVSAFAVSSSKTVPVVGDEISFTARFSERVYIGGGVNVVFKIGGVRRTSSSCDSYLSSTADSIVCKYAVVEGDVGSLSDVKLNNTDKIKGFYSNYIPLKTVDIVDFSNNVSGIDGIKPYITGINAGGGLFSEGLSVSVEVSFSEVLKVNPSFEVPVLTVKFEDGANQTCNISSSIGVENKLIYNCFVTSSNFGKMSFVSITGGGGIIDNAGNPITLVDVQGKVISEKEFSDVSVNNNIPSLEITVNKDDCTSDEGKYYCVTGEKIIIDFEFDMVGSFENWNVELFFGGNLGAGVTSSSFVGEKLKFEYVVSGNDNGKLQLSYQFKYEAENGKVTNVSNIREEEIYVDNSSPVLAAGGVEANNELVSGYEIFGAKGAIITFVMSVADASEVTFDSSKVSVLSNGDVKVETCETCDIKQITSVFEDGELRVSLILGKDNIRKDFKIRVEKDAFKDYFNNTLSEDYVTNLYTFDTNYPTFEINVSYPMYKGYNSADKWVLISGETINFTITSEDNDLKDYCIVAGDDCGKYFSFEKGVVYSQSISNVIEGENTFVIKVRDKALNVSSKEATFVLENMFEYSNGLGVAAKNHSISVDVSLFEGGTNFKYSWFKRGASVNFSGANVTSKQDDVITIDGSDSYNGEYMLCINRVKDDVTLCSEFVEFDNVIDQFVVDVSDYWTNQNITANIIFNDSNTIRCLAIGKNYSNVNCEGNNENVIVYKTSQAISPFNKYVISENGVYYFYIEDAVGNSLVESRDIIVLDRESVNIEIFNGANGEEYNSNLELVSYKQAHSFLVVFDKQINSSSSHLYYKYFFSTSNYTITNIDDFNNYYLKSLYKGEVNNPSSNKMYISTPSSSDIYYLYIVASDKARNLSFASVSDIKVDVEGPSIKAYDKGGALTNSVGSSNFVVSFDYSFVVEDYDSKLDLNNVYYNWVDGFNNKVFGSDKKYELCSFDYNMCRIKGENIEFGKGLFAPTESYKFVLAVYDNAGNLSKFTSSSFKIDTTSPIVTTVIDDSKWYNVNSFDIVVSKENNVGTLDGISYCINDCKNGSDYNLSKFINLVVVNPTKETKTVSLDLVQGANTLYVYARDVFGNYVYEEYIINYDKDDPVVVVDEEIDLSDSEDKNIEFTINDSLSGIKNYCIYLNEDNKDCYSLAGEKSKNVSYLVDIAGTYYIEVVDEANNIKVYSVKVTGVDNEPISFELVSSVKEGKFTNGDVTISLSDIRDSTSDDVSESVKTIDYIVLPYDSIVGDYDEAFESGVVNVYTSGNGTLVTSFKATSNSLYIVRVKDLANNVSYKRININSIDKEAPIIDTNTYANGEDRIYLYGENDNVVKDDYTGEYEYSNDTLMLYVGEDSLKDKYTNYNSYLALNVCFKYENGNCDYESYLLKTKLNGNKDYIINRSLEITAPYDFSGEIYYYVVDGAGNSSDVKSFVVNYVISANTPVISYAVKNNGSYNNYKIIHNEAYVSGSIKLKFEDTDLDYFEIYTNSVLESRCYITSVVNDLNCDKTGDGEIGFVVEDGKIYYYLNSGNHIIKAYDVTLNVKEVNIYTDSGRPVVNVYKKIGATYNLQTLENGTIFNSLDGLYVKVSEETFSYMNIDLHNSRTGDRVLSASRYSYVNELGECLYDSSVCEYGASINDLLVVSTRGYNQIIVTVYDKASNYSTIVISYDVETPEIILANEGENVFVNGIIYNIEADVTVKVQIGANNRLTLDNLLNEVVKSVDGYSYSQARTSALFNVKVYKGGNAYAEDAFANIGSYEIELNYADEAGNVAVSKFVNVVVEDKVRPIGVIMDASDRVEIKELVTINGVRFTDNYGLEEKNGNLVKEKVLALTMSSCSLVSNEGNVSCLGNVENVSSNSYRFVVAGTYTFTYTISDLAGNTVEIVQTLYVNDNKGPVMDADDNSIVVEVGERNEDQTINIGEIQVKYPTSYDDGDDEDRTVDFVGLFSVNNMLEKYKIIDDVYLVSDVEKVLTYKFDKIGVYYLRFISSDKSGNVSIFEYEISVVDSMAPVISGISNEQVIEIELGTKFDVEEILSSYSISSKDNYDESVSLSYDVNEGEEHTYEITFTSSDSSNNINNVVVYVDVIDTVKPLVGELVIVESTNVNNLSFRVIGGEDNSNRFYHEYSVQNGIWSRYEESSVIEFGNGLSTTVKVCIRAVDYSSNISEYTDCKDVLVDTKAPSISGVSEGTIYNKEVTVNISDDRLESIEITLNNELLDVSIDDLPANLSEVGNYGVIARDVLGNVSSINFVINIDAYMQVVNDVNADEYTTTSIDFDKRFLVKADIEYNNNGDSKIDIALNNISLQPNDMIYVLGVVPNTSSTFVMFSASSDNIVNYEEGVTLLGYGNSFKDGVNNEDCLVKINDDYYVYLIVKENVDSSPVVVEEEEEEEKNNVLKIILMVVGSLATLLIGYQILKFKKRVRAA